MKISKLKTEKLKAALNQILIKKQRQTFFPYKDYFNFPQGHQYNLIVSPAANVVPEARYILRLTPLCQEEDLSRGALPYYTNDCENHALLSALWHFSPRLEAHPVHFNARRPATSSSIYSGENYKAQSIQMCPTKLNTSLSDKQPLFPVIQHRGNLVLQIALERPQRGAGFTRAK